MGTLLYMNKSLYIFVYLEYVYYNSNCIMLYYIERINIRYLNMLSSNEHRQIKTNRGLVGYRVSHHLLGNIPAALRSAVKP